MSLGLALIIPIGPQNVLVLNQSIAVGMLRALVVVVTVGICDSLLILAGAVGVSAVLAGCGSTVAQASSSYCSQSC
ncbi:MAG: LysE family transporter [Pseudonocardiaceae bacterium]